MSKAQPKAEIEKPEAEVEDDQLNRAIEELRGVLSEEEKRPEAMRAAAAAGNSVILDIPVEVQIVLGSTEMPVSDLMTLQKGSTVALDRRIGEPVDVVVNGRRIARGEITVLENDPSRFGIRLTEIVAAAKKS
ncbi:flagellar motor switch protein FliN [Aminobacter sp. HY435]|uniref:flagellar motor switch protein FliN n=1 Tax=Aminobacter sp. HY435 TaxID=2970917 RepID=UPI0022B95EDA|nr:flagellar motor switch protein FliN [Aminobacter sp. HY435]